MVGEFDYSSFGTKLLGTRCRLREIFPCCQLRKVSFGSFEVILKVILRYLKTIEFKNEEFMTSIIIFDLIFYDLNDVTGI